MTQITSQNERNWILQGRKSLKQMVGPNGLEPLTSTVSRWRSSQLSYGPTDLSQS
jgi:hypothetical protein